MKEQVSSPRSIEEANARKNTNCRAWGLGSLNSLVLREHRTRTVDSGPDQRGRRAQTTTLLYFIRCMREYRFRLELLRQRDIAMIGRLSAMALTTDRTRRV